MILEKRQLKQKLVVHLLPLLTENMSPLPTDQIQNLNWVRNPQLEGWLDILSNCEQHCPNGIMLAAEREGLVIGGVSVFPFYFSRGSSSGQLWFPLWCSGRVQIHYQNENALNWFLCIRHMSLSARLSSNMSPATIWQLNILIALRLDVFLCIPWCDRGF